MTELMKQFQEVVEEEGDLSILQLKIEDFLTKTVGEGLVEENWRMCS